MPASEADLFTFLEGLGIATRTVAHPPLFTVEESQSLRGTIPGAHTKNLFLKDKKGIFTLISCLEDRQVRIRAVEKAIGAAKCSFGKPDALEDVLGVYPGAVTIFALINNRLEPRVRVVLDKALLAAEYVNAHPLHNEATSSITPDDLLRFIAACGHAPIILDFDELEQ